MPMHCYLLRRGSRLSFRCRIPTAIACRIGRKEIVRTLGVSSHRVAAFVAAAISLRVADLWEQLGAMSDGNEARRLIDGWFQGEVARAYRQFASLQMGSVVTQPAASRSEVARLNRWFTGDDATNRMERLTEDFQAGDYSAAFPAARQIISDIGASVTETDQSFTIISKMVMRAFGELEQARVQWSEGEEEYRAHFPWPARAIPSAPRVSMPEGADSSAPLVPQAGSSSTTTSPVCPTGSTVEGGVTLGEAIETYLELRKRERKSTLKQLGQTRSQLSVLTSAWGVNYPVASVTRGQAGQVFVALRYLPKEFKTHPDLKGLPFFDAAKRARELELIPLHQKTINNYLTTFRSLFSAQIEQGLTLESNPFAGMTVDVPDAGESERAFTQEEMERLFAAPAFHGCLRDNAPFRPGSFMLKDYRFWGPLLACLTGARISELAQLTPDDIYQEDSVWIIDFNDKGNKRLKTNSSRRKVPVHSELQRIGLLKFAAERKAIRAPTLLGIPMPRNGNAGQKPGGWLRERFLPSLFTEKRKGVGFHSFRHSMENMFRANGVREETGNRITGHVTPGVHAKYGSHDLKVLQATLEGLTIPQSIKAIPPR